MITDIFISLGGYIVGFLIDLLPTSTGFPSAVITASQSIGEHVGMLNPIIPIGTLASVLALILTVEGVIFAFKTAKWVVGYLPVIGGKG